MKKQKPSPLKGLDKVIQKTLTLFPNPNEDIILHVFQHIKNDPDCLEEYEDAVSKSAKPHKAHNQGAVNMYIGRRICSTLGRKKIGRKLVSGELIKSYSTIA